MKAIATFPLPPTLNDQVDAARTHWQKSAGLKKKWTNLIVKGAIDQGMPQFPGKVWLEFRYAVKNFGRDPDNISASRKFLMDGLVSAGVLTKDSLMIIQSPIIEWFDRGEDSVTIVVSDRPIWIVEAVK